ncbi:MAG TPA: TonB-dependent siderophore receptor [Bryobacteraceae bacterium]|nr:TonB-dependent siderophore receptor [Bryobacteraceae bacterium]
MKQGKATRSARGSWPVAYRMLAVGTLVAYSALGVKTVALAQDLPGKSNGGVSSPDSGALPVRRFDIAAGPLGAVLDAFAATSGVNPELQSENLRSIDSPGVSGLLTTEQALKQLLAGTGVDYQFTAADRVSIELRGPGERVEVTDTIALTSPKYSQPLRDIPQTITVIPKALMEQQAATTLRDVLRNVSGLTMTAGEGGVPAGDNLTIRGFSARNDIFVDGVRDLGAQSRDPFNLEQVEVVKGPSSALAGRGSTGGTINLVNKMPSLRQSFGGSVNYGTDGTKRLTGDLNVPLRMLGERAAFRLNAMVHESGVAGRNVVENGRWGVAPSIALGLGTPTRLTLSYYKLKQDNIPDYGIPWVPATNNALAEYRDQPAPVDRENFYGMRTRDRERTGADMATARVEHEFSDTMSLRNQFRYGRSTRDSITTSPRVLTNDSTVINRSSPSWLTEDQVWDDQADFSARFRTGGLEHSVVAGLALTRESSIRRTRTAANIPTTDLFNPDPEQVFAGTLTVSPLVGDLAANSQALYAFDTVKVGERWQFNGGLRWDRFDVDGVSTAGAPLTRVDRMTSLRGGAVFKPKSNGSVYASYGTSLNPSLEGLSYQPAGTTIEPEKTYTAEVGTKWDVLGERVQLTGALFRVEKTNARTPGVAPEDPPQVLDGRQRVNGVEMGASGSITRRWKVFGAYTFLDSKVVESNTAAEVDRKIQNTPKHSFNIWSTHSFSRLEVGGGVRFADRRYGNATNTRQVPSYWTLDAMAAYRVNQHLDLRLNLFNLNDAFYFDRLGGGHLVPGAARSVMISSSFRF